MPTPTSAGPCQSTPPLSAPTNTPPEPQKGAACRNEPDDHALGRSRGGLSTKIHLAADSHARPLALTVTAGQAGDAPAFETVMACIRVPRSGPGRPRTRPVMILADRAIHPVAWPGHTDRQARDRLSSRSPPRRHPHLDTPLTAKQTEPSRPGAPTHWPIAAKATRCAATQPPRPTTHRPIAAVPTRRAATRAARPAHSPYAAELTRRAAEPRPRPQPSSR